MYEKGFAYLLQGEHEKVIYGVLKRLHVSRQDPDYEDLVVEGQIAFAQAYCAYCQAHDSVTEEAVMPYIYQKVKWRLLDLLRKQTRTKQRECGLQDTGRIPTSCLKKYSLNRVSNFMGSLQHYTTNY